MRRVVSGFVNMGSGLRLADLKPWLRAFAFGAYMWLIPLSSAQAVVGSANVICGPSYGWQTSGPIVGGIINQTSTTITDLEVELSIITRDKKGRLTRQRDTRFVVVPSLNQNGIVTQLRPAGDVYFSIPSRKSDRDWEDDQTCQKKSWFKIRFLISRPSRLHESTGNC